MDELCKNFSRKVERNYSLQEKHLFKKSAGEANGYYQLFFDDTLEMDLQMLHRLYVRNLPFKVLGLHTNLMITEKGYRGLFVDVSPKNSFIRFNEDDKSFTVSSNIKVAELVNHTMKEGYDFSALAGVPGFVGSGVVGNSGWTPTQKDFSYFVKKIVAYDFEENQYVEFFPDEGFWGERDSFLKRKNKAMTRFFVKEVVLKSEYLGEEIVREKYYNQLLKRKESLKYGFQEGTAGSLWSNGYLKKNCGVAFPRMLIEHPDIRVEFNGAQYSPNGNMFFTTSVDTRDKDVARLFAYTLDKVQEYYGIVPKKEIMILDYDGEIEVETFVDRYL